MARITVIPDDWDGELGELYTRVVDPAWDRVDHILAIHSLSPAAWPHTKISTNRPAPRPAYENDSRPELPDQRAPSTILGPTQLQQVHSRLRQVPDRLREHPAELAEHLDGPLPVPRPALAVRRVDGV